MYLFVHICICTEIHTYMYICVHIYQCYHTKIYKIQLYFISKTVIIPYIKVLIKYCHVKWRNLNLWKETGKVVGFSLLFFVCFCHLIHSPKHIYSFGNWEAILPLLLCFLTSSFLLLCISTLLTCLRPSGSYEDQRAENGRIEYTVHSTLKEMESLKGKPVPQHFVKDVENQVV